MKIKYILLIMLLIAGLSIVIFVSMLGRTWIKTSVSTSAVTSQNLTTTPSPFKYSKTTDLIKELEQINPEIKESDFEE